MARIKKSHGSSTVELMAGTIVVIPVILLLIDLGTMVVASSINDNLAKQAARAASNQYPPGTPVDDQGRVRAQDPQGAAGRVIDKLIGTTRSAPKGVFLQVEALGPPDVNGNPKAFGTGQGPNCTYNDQSDPDNKGYVVVTTRMTISLPIPVVMLPEKQSFTTSAKVPIVAMTAK